MLFLFCLLIFSDRLDREDGWTGPGYVGPDPALPGEPGELPRQDPGPTQAAHP